MTLNVDPKLQHCNLVWTIENFRLRRRPREPVESPIYELKSWFETKWKMVLEFHEKDGEVYLSVVLKLCDISNNIKELTVRCRLNLFIRSWIQMERRHFFQKDDSLTFEDFATLDDVNESTNIILEDSLSVRIEVLVKDPRPLSVPKHLIDKNILALSDNLKYLYEGRIYSDLIIEAHGKEFDAHMCIFEARCSNARRLLRNDDRTIVNVATSKPYVVERLIYFMYTGDIYSVLNDPVIGMAECAEEFGIGDLERIMKPDEIVAKTKIEMQKCTYSWTIGNFTELMENRKIRLTSPLLNEGQQKVLWRLQIDGHKDHLSIYADVMEIVDDLSVWFEVSILNDKYQKCVTKETFQFKSGRCGFRSLVDWKYFHKNPNLLTNDTLRLFCAIKFSTGALKEALVDREFTLCSNAPYAKTYKTLSNDILSLFINGNRSDISFKVSGEIFPLHKPILACRSAVLYAVMDLNQRDYIEEDDMDSMAFEAMMRYVYGGVLCDMGVNVALQVFVQAYFWNMTHLTGAYSIVLQNLLTVECMYTVLMKTWDLPDNELKKALARFIYFNSAEIFTRQEWKLFKEKRPRSHELVMNAVNNVASEQESAIIQENS